MNTALDLAGKDPDISKTEWKRVEYENYIYQMHPNSNISVALYLFANKSPVITLSSNNLAVVFTGCSVTRNWAERQTHSAQVFTQHSSSMILDT